MFLGNLAECPEFVIPSVDRQHVYMSRRVLDGRENTVEVAEAGRVALDRRCVAADRGDGFVEFGLATPGDKHARAFCGKALGDAEAYAGTAARRQRDFACELACHPEPSFGL